MPMVRVVLRFRGVCAALRQQDSWGSSLYGRGLNLKGPRWKICPGTPSAVCGKCLEIGRKNEVKAKPVTMVRGDLLRSTNRNYLLIYAYLNHSKNAAASTTTIVRPMTFSASVLSLVGAAFSFNSALAASAATVAPTTNFLLPDAKNHMFFLLCQFLVVIRDRAVQRQFNQQDMCFRSVPVVVNLFVDLVDNLFRGRFVRRIIFLQCSSP
jgi:hypothetical protein